MTNVVSKNFTTQKAAKAFLADIAARYPHRNYEIRYAVGGGGKLVVVCTNAGEVVSPASADVDWTITPHLLRPEGPIGEVAHCATCGQPARPILDVHCYAHD